MYKAPHLFEDPLHFLNHLTPHNSQHLISNPLNHSHPHFNFFLNHFLLIFSTLYCYFHLRYLLLNISLLFDQRSKIFTKTSAHYSILHFNHLHRFHLHHLQLFLEELLLFVILKGFVIFLPFLR